MTQVEELQNIITESALSLIECCVKYAILTQSLASEREAVDIAYDWCSRLVRKELFRQMANELLDERVRSEIKIEE